MSPGTEESVCVCEREIERVCVCVCVCEREREWPESAALLPAVSRITCTQHLTGYAPWHTIIHQQLTSPPAHNNTQSAFVTDRFHKLTTNLYDFFMDRSLSGLNVSKIKTRNMIRSPGWNLESMTRDFASVGWFSKPPHPTTSQKYAAVPKGARICGS